MTLQSYAKIETKTPNEIRDICEFEARNDYTHNNYTIEATSAILICKETGEILWEKNETQKMPPASCAKLLTAIVALNYCAPTNLMLLPENEYYLPDCTGLKTGTTEEAGACLVSSFAKTDYNYICVLLGSIFI